MAEPALRWFTSPADVDRELHEALIGCWARVSNAGGAVGFPFLPVDEAEVRGAAGRLVGGLSTGRQLLVATVEDRLAGWLALTRNDWELTRHWATVTRVQSDLPHRGQGVGAALMREVARHAREDLGLEQLHLDVRSGLGLEDFYARLGWRVVGRWPSAMRLAEGDDRDEILMLLEL